MAIILKWALTFFSKVLLLITSGWLPRKCLGPDVANSNFFIWKNGESLFYLNHKCFVFGFYFSEKKIAQKQNTDITTFLFLKPKTDSCVPSFLAPHSNTDRPTWPSGLTASHSLTHSHCACVSVLLAHFINSHVLLSCFSLCGVSLHSIAHTLFFLLGVFS